MCFTTVWFRKLLISQQLDKPVHETTRSFISVGIASAIGSIALYCWFTFHYASSAVYWDQWTQASLLLGHFEHTLTLGQLWAQHNENRMFFPQVINLLLGIVSHENSKVTIFFDLLLQLASFGLIAYGLSRIARGKSYWLNLAVISPLILSLGFFEDITWAFQSAWYLIYLCVAFCFVSLSFPESKRWTALSLASVAVASFSSFQGLVLGPSLALIFFFAGRKRLAQIYAIASALLFIIYFWGLNISNTGGAGISFSHPLKMASYALVLFGSVFASPQTTHFGNLPIGLLGLVLVVVGLVALALALRFVRSDLRLLPGLLLIIYSLATSASITVGRWSFGPVQALSSRYILYTLLLPIGTIITFYLVAPKVTRMELIKTARWGLVALLICQIPLAISSGIVNERTSHRKRQVINAIVANYKTATDTQIIQDVYPFRPATRRTIMRNMRIFQVGVFASPRYFYYRIEGPHAKVFKFNPLPLNGHGGKTYSAASSTGLAIASAVFHASSKARAQFPKSTTGDICPFVDWLLSPRTKGTSYKSVLVKNRSDLVALSRYASCNSPGG